MPSIHKHEDGPALLAVALIILCVVGSVFWEPLFLIAILFLAAIIYRER